ncbi:MAG: transglutaminase-like domain-containing protein [Pirellulaceae bacterium]
MLFQSADGNLLSDNRGELTREQWYVHRVDGLKLGSRWLREYSFEVRGQMRVRRVVLDEIEGQRFGQHYERSVRVVSLERSGGELLAVSSEVRAGGTPVVTHCKVFEGQLYVKMCDVDRDRYDVLDWSEDCRGPLAVEDSLRRSPMKVGESREVRYFDPVVQRMIDAKLVAREWEDTTMNDTGELLSLLRIESANAGPGITRWMDAAGSLVRSDDAFMAQSMCAATALAANAPNDTWDVDLAVKARVELTPPFPVRPAQPFAMAKYRVTMKDASPTAVFAESETQSVSAVDARTAIISVVASLPQVVGTSPSDRPIEQDIAANRWIQSSDPSIRQFAGTATGGATEPNSMLQAMRRHVFHSLRKVDFSQTFASAVEVVRSREGDCSEHAVLLAAICRAQGLPARVVVGMIYDDLIRGFVYHTWNEVWVGGRWVPVDATERNDPPSVGHLKITHSNLHGGWDTSLVAPVMRVVGRTTIELVAYE